MSLLFFLDETEEVAPYWLFINFLIIVQNKQRKGKIKKHQLRLVSHDSISLAHLSFALWITKANSFLKTSLQCSTEGFTLLNNQAFRFFQMHHIISIMISNAKGRFKDLFICLVARSGLAKLELSPQFETNNFFAKEHLKNKCMFNSSTCLKQSSHAYESRTICLFLSIDLVFNLFCKSSQ
jgi:hypothetical protein